MTNHHQLGYAVLLSSVLYFSFLIAAPISAVAQGTETAATTAQGIQRYEFGDAQGAIKILKEVVNKHCLDADAWYYLGLALNSEGLFGEARQPFEHTIELRPGNADAHSKLAYALILSNQLPRATAMAQRAIELGGQTAEAPYAIAEASFRTAGVETAMLEKAIEQAEVALRLDPNFSPALITKSSAQYKLKQHSEAAASLERFLAIDPDGVDAEIWREQLTRLRELSGQPATIKSPANAMALTGSQVTQKARILRKLEPSYTEAARKAGVEGTVVLRAVFSSEGEVKSVHVVQALPYGLTTEAVRAARDIKFQPATKDGQPASMWFQLEYNFHLY